MVSNAKKCSWMLNNVEFKYFGIMSKVSSSILFEHLSEASQSSISAMNTKKGLEILNNAQKHWEMERYAQKYSEMFYNFEF